MSKLIYLILIFGIFSSAALSRGGLRFLQNNDDDNDGVPDNQDQTNNQDNDGIPDGGDTKEITLVGNNPQDIGNAVTKGIALILNTIGTRSNEIGNFVGQNVSQTIQTTENIGPVIANMIGTRVGQVITAIATSLGVTANDIGNAIGGGVNDALTVAEANPENPADAIGNLVRDTIANASNNPAQINQSVTDAVNNAFQGSNVIPPSITNQAGTGAVNAINAMNTNVDQIRAAVVNFVNNALQNRNDVPFAAGQAWASVIQAIRDNAAAVGVGIGGVVGSVLTNAQIATPDEITQIQNRVSQDVTNSINSNNQTFDDIRREVSDAVFDAIKEGNNGTAIDVVTIINFLSNRTANSISNSANDIQNFGRIAAFPNLIINSPQEIGNAVSNMVKQILTEISQVPQILADRIETNITDRIQNPVLAGELGPQINQVILNSVSALGNVSDDIGTVVGALVAEAIIAGEANPQDPGTAVKNVLTNELDFAGNNSEVINNAVTNAVNDALKNISVVPADINTQAGTVVVNALNTLKANADEIQNAITNLVNNVTGRTNNVQDAFAQGSNDVWQSLTDNANNVGNGIGNAVADILNNAQVASPDQIDQARTQVSQAVANAITNPTQLVTDTRTQVNGAVYSGLGTLNSNTDMVGVINEISNAVVTAIRNVTGQTLPPGQSGN